MSVAAARCHKAQDFHTKVRMAAEKIVQLKITKGTSDQFPMDHLLQNMISLEPFKEVLWS